MACCVYLVFYVIIPLIRTSSDENDTMNPALKSAIIAVFIAVTATFFVVTIIEVVRNWKAGNFKATAYTDDDFATGGINNENAVSAESRTQDAVLEDGVDDEYQDEDWDEDWDEDEDECEDDENKELIS